MENEEVTVIIEAKITVKYKPYNHEGLNKKASEQMLVWVEETLKEEHQIPLFINDNSGKESTTFKQVEVRIK